MDESSPLSRHAALGTTKFPECTSRRAASISSSSFMLPRAPPEMVGRPLSCLGPSVTRTRSAARRSRCFSVKSPKKGLPISSSPSRMSFTFTLGARPAASMHASASRWHQIGPLSSEAPRAYTRCAARASVDTASKGTMGAPVSARPARNTGSTGEGCSQPSRGMGLVS